MSLACRRAIAVALALVVSGCLSGLVPETAPVATYDFGPVENEPAAPLPHAVQLRAVTAPSWLQTPNIYYRRLDEQPNSLTAYAQNRWIATTPELFAERLAYRLAAAAPDSVAGGVVAIEIVRFEHVYEPSGGAHVIAHAVASYEDSQAGAHRRTFVRRLPAGASVAGATAELPVVAEAVIADVLAWLSAEAAGDR